MVNEHGNVWSPKVSDWVEDEWPQVGVVMVLGGGGKIAHHYNSHGESDGKTGATTFALKARTHVMIRALGSSTEDAETVLSATVCKAVRCSLIQL